MNIQLNSPLAESHHSQVPLAVIGGGIIGLCIALKLQSQGVQVVLIEKNTIGSGASFGNAGHIATEQVFPVAHPSMLKKIPQMLFNPLGPLRVDWRYLPRLMPWGIKLLQHLRKKPFEHSHQQLKQLNAAALPAWKTWIKTWQLEPFVKIEGSLLVAEKPKTIKVLQQQGVRLNQMGVKNYWLNQADLAAKEPLLANQLGGLFFPDTGHVLDIPRVIEKLTQSFLALGGQVQEYTTVKQIEKQAQGVQLVLVAKGQTQYQQAAQVVICCGAFSKDFTAKLTGIQVPLETERGYHYSLPQAEGQLNIPVSSADRMFIMTPMKLSPGQATVGLRLAGTVEYGGLQAKPNMQRAYNLLRLANGMFKTPLNEMNGSTWMGFRPTLVDSLPVIDQVNEQFFAFGHQHLGLTHAPYTAELVSDLYFGKKVNTDESLHAFRLDRFS